MKKIFTFLIIFGFLIILNASSVSAQSANGLAPNPPVRGRNGIDNNHEFDQSSNSANRGIPQNRREMSQDQRITNIKTHADQEINRRITSLNGLITSLKVMKRLSDTQKSTLINQVQQNIDALSALKTKIASDTDMVTLRADIESVVKAYRIYLLFIPKIRILAASDMILDTADKLSSSAAMIQTKIDQQQANGEDVSVLQNSLKDLESKIADAISKAQNAQNAVLPLTPEGYPDNKSILESARAMLKDAHQDLKDARTDIHTIIKGLKKEHPTPRISGVPNSTRSSHPRDSIGF